MMVEITCSESGIVFEAETRRTKQHPLIAALKAEGNKAGTYREVNAALMAIRKAGGYTTIEEFMSLVKQHMTGEKEVADAREERLRLARIEEDRKFKERRQQINALLKEHGYKWEVEYVERDAPALEWRDEGKYFHLIAPDGREVTEAQALAEIERGVETVRAEMAAKEAEAKAQRESETEKQRQQEVSDRAAYAAFDAEAERLTAGMTQVERFNWQRGEIVYRMPAVSGSYRRRDYIEVTQHNGVKCVITITGSGYDDDGYSACYCVDPDKAGLTVATKSDHPSFF